VVIPSVSAQPIQSASTDQQGSGARYASLASYDLAASE
jgi:hypothetical protein